MKKAQTWIRGLQLEPHPEGGFYKQTEIANKTITVNHHKRALYTSIYFLLTKDNPSRFHQLTSDEIWYFHDGYPLTIHCLFGDGTYEKVKIGKNVDKGEQLHYVVPAGTIFASSVSDAYALVSCAVVPGFDFSDFNLLTQEELVTKYPENEEVIRQLAFKSL